MGETTIDYRSVLEKFELWVQTCKTGYGRQEIMHKLAELKQEASNTVPKPPQGVDGRNLCTSYVIGFMNTSRGEECVLSEPYSTPPADEVIAEGIWSYGADYAVVEERYYLQIPDGYDKWARSDNDSNYRPIPDEEDDLPF